MSKPTGRWMAVKDPASPGRYRVKNSRTGDLAGPSFKGLAAAARHARHLNNPDHKENDRG